MKISKSELAKILQEETAKFNIKPDPKYVKVLQGDVLHKSKTLKESVEGKISKLNDREKTRVLEEILEHLEKIYTLI